MKVKNLMSTAVCAVRPELTLLEAVRLMRAQGVSGLPVVDDSGRLVGVMSEMDVIKALLPSSNSGGESGTLDERANAVREMTVGQIMSNCVVWVTEDTPIEKAASQLVLRRIKRLPVLRDGTLVGIISRIDICDALLEGQLEQEYAILVGAMAGPVPCSEAA